MSEWTFILTPLLVLPIVLLFRFVGCGLDVHGTKEPDPEPKPAPPTPAPTPTPTPPPTPTPTDNKPPNYQKYILGEQPNPGQVAHPQVVPNGADVIGYWRLVDGPASTVAEDKKGLFTGPDAAQYQQGYTLPNVAPTTANAGSKGASPARFTTGKSSLIDSDPAVMCRSFDGGHVRVPYKALPAPNKMYTDEFTIEAWILADTFDKDFEFVLFDAGGRYVSTPSPLANRGFRVFVNRQQGWQVQLAPDNKDLFPTAPAVPLKLRTHVALTVENNPPSGPQKKVTLYIDGKPVVSPVPVNSYNPPVGAPLFIGIENTATVPTTTPTLRHPVFCRVQEVVLHRKALSREEIENHVNINRK